MAAVELRRDDDDDGRKEVGGNSNQNGVGAVLVGRWPALAKASDGLIGPLHLEYSELTPQAVKRAAARHQRPWVMAGGGVDERTLADAWRAVLMMRPSARLGMLGPYRDPQRCDRWMRRGCSFYLCESARPAEIHNAVALAATEGLAVVGLEFLGRRPAFTGRVLSDRDERVLELLCEGWHNAEIAAALSISENTVEFRVRQLLQKLGARNRVQAVAFGIRHGLV